MNVVRLPLRGHQHLSNAALLDEFAAALDARDARGEALNLMVPTRSPLRGNRAPGT
jgi:hypothetical protein